MLLSQCTRRETINVAWLNQMNYSDIDFGLTIEIPDNWVPLLLETSLAQIFKHTYLKLAQIVVLKNSDSLESLCVRH